ncbi:MAG: GNAT family N-acetyltransferase, partial [Clostridia bacterium]
FENLTLENQKKENAKYLAKLRRNVIKIKQNKINYIDLLKIDVNNVNNIEQLVRFINNSFEKILELNCNYSQRNTLKNEILFEVFGVRTMFDNESIVAFMEKIVNLIKTFNCDLKTNDCEQLKKLYEFLVEYFLFLQGTGINDSLTNNIYPLVANYASGVNSVDGYTFAYFNVENTQSKTFNKIKVITGDEYSFDETYYCVPNINRIAKIEDENDVYKEIWISPIIIPCSIFYSNFVANITRLDNVSDYAATAALIYETDEQIYSSLFGSKENALKILPLLFENNFSNFYKDNIFICKKDQQVIAVLCVSNLFSTKFVEWNPIIIKNAFTFCNIELPSDFENANNYFKDTYAHYTGDNCCEITDLCVDSKYRQNGIGKFLMTYVVKKALTYRKDVLITVYEDNFKAINLYYELGFIAYLTDEDNRGQILNDSKYYKMIKYNMFNDVESPLFNN